MTEEQKGRALALLRYKIERADTTEASAQLHRAAEAILKSYGLAKLSDTNDQTTIETIIRRWETEL